MFDYSVLDAEQCPTDIKLEDEKPKPDAEPSLTTNVKTSPTTDPDADKIVNKIALKNLKCFEIAQKF